MRFKLSILIFAFLAFAPRAFAQERAFNSETFTLKNGMQVVVIPNHHAPVINQMVWYKVGAIDEVRGESGIAHYVEHLMFKGTHAVAAGQFSRLIRAMGGEENAFTSYDYTVYHQSASLENLPRIMQLESDRMAHLSFPPQDVLHERDVVIEERRMRTENDPRGYFYEQLRAQLFINHPYGNPVLGWLNEVNVLDRDHVKAFYDRWYAPNNAILIVSGDITAAQLKPLAEKTYGAVPAKTLPARHWSQVPPLRGLTTLEMHAHGIRQPAIERIYRVPSYVQNKTDSLALQVLENIMSAGSSTRLYKTLVVEQKKATGASMNYDGDCVSDGTVSFGITPAEGVTPQQDGQALDDVLRAVIKDGVTEAELREAKDRLKDEAIYARDSLTTPGMVFGEALATGSTVDDVEYWPENIDKVTAAQVQDVAKRYLNPDDIGTRPYTTGWLLPVAGASAADEPEPAMQPPSEMVR